MVRQMKFFMINLLFTWWCPYFILRLLKTPVLIYAVYSMSFRKIIRQRKYDPLNKTCSYRSKYSIDSYYNKWWTSCFAETELERVKIIDGMKHYDYMSGFTIKRIVPLKETKNK